MDSTPIVCKFRDLQKIHTTGVRFADGRGVSELVSYGALIDEARKFARALTRAGARRNEPVILVMIQPHSAIVAILGCMIAGCPPAPVYPPSGMQAVPNFLTFLKHVAERSGACMLIAEGQINKFVGHIPFEARSIRAVHRLETLLQETDSVDLPSDPAASTAFLQFTSGSTSTPKGVIVPHTALAANLWMIREACSMSTSSSVVTWLPVYHDMGLIGTVLNAITLPCDLVVASPLAFLKRPRLWLELISRFRGTHTAAPNFAYGLCNRRITDLSGLDLSSMTTFICGAEPVLARTMRDFVERFQGTGLRSGAMVPAYGLAEATLAVTFSPYMQGIKTDRVHLDELSNGRAIAATSSERHAADLVSCGRPLKGVSLRIAHDSVSLCERQVGEIQLLAPTVSPGYIGDQTATQASRTEDGWLRTGDLGYVVNGELVPCGRIKDVIIIRGKNFHAHDIETAASEVSGVRTGNVVAFSADSSSRGEDLIVVAESRNLNDAKRLAHDVRRRIAETTGITPQEVLIVPPGTLPKTSSGKLKRQETRTRFERGTLLQKPSSLAAMQAAVKSSIGFMRARLKRPRCLNL